MEGRSRSRSLGQVATREEHSDGLAVRWRLRTAEVTTVACSMSFGPALSSLDGPDRDGVGLHAVRTRSLIVSANVEGEDTGLGQ